MYMDSAGDSAQDYYAEAAQARMNAHFHRLFLDACDARQEHPESMRLHGHRINHELFGVSVKEHGARKARAGSATDQPFFYREYPSGAEYIIGLRRKLKAARRREHDRQEAEVRRLCHALVLDNAANIRMRIIRADRRMP